MTMATQNNPSRAGASGNYRTRKPKDDRPPPIAKPGDMVVTAGAHALSPDQQVSLYVEPSKR